MNSLPSKRDRRVMWYLLVLAATLQAIFAEPSDEPQRLQQSGIAKIDQWMDYVRRTGDAKSTIQELEAAQSKLQASYNLFLKRQDFADASLSAIKMAEIQRLESQWRQAVPIYLDAIRLAQRANRTDYQTKALTRQAYCELRLGETDAASDHIREASRLGQNCGNNAFYFEALDVAGEIEVKRGNLVAAGEYLDRALAMSGQIDDKRQLYVGYMDRGDIYYQLSLKGDYERNYDIYLQSLKLARTDYQKAIALSRELGYEFITQQLETCVRSADAREALIEHNRKTDRTITDLKLFNPQKPTDVLATEYFTYGALSPAMLAPIGTAVKELKDFLARMQQQGLIVLDLNPLDLFIQGELADMKGDSDAALVAYQQAVDLLEKDRRKLRDEQARGAYLEDKIVYYYRPALLLLGRKQYSEAFRLFELSRSRALADLLASRPPALGTLQERTLFSQLQSLKTNIAAQQEKLFDLTGSQNRDQNAKEIVRLENQITDLQQQYDQIESRIAQEAPKLKQLTTREPVRLEDVQRSAAEGGYDVLYYVVLEHAVILWHIDGDGVQVRNVFLPHAQLVKKTTALRNSLVEPKRKEAAGANFDEQTSRQLFLYLIQPVLSSIKSNHLIVIPHEELNLIPFQALENPATGMYLGESFAISYAPSTTVLATLENNSVLRGGRLLLVADPNIHDAKEEANAIEKLYPGRCRVVAQALANKVDVETWMSDYNVVHLSVHGLFNESDPLLSYLQFQEVPPENGRLTAAEMFGLPLQKNSLVVLSACETGRVEATHASEVLGMVRSLLYAGAGNLALSLWEVNAGSTKLWMETFYKEGRTNPPVEAARRALIAVKSLPEYSHPFFWAPFVMIGK